MLSHFSRVQLFVTLRSAACQAPLSMGFSRQKYWSGLPCPLPGNPDPGIKPESLMSPALESRFFITGKAKESTTWYVGVKQRSLPQTYLVFLSSIFPHFGLSTCLVCCYVPFPNIVYSCIHLSILNDSQCLQTKL